MDLAMVANDISFKDLELFTWYHIKSSEFGDFWMMIFKKTNQIHRSFSYSQDDWVEPRGKVFRNEWEGGLFGIMPGYTTKESSDWDTNCRRAIKTVFAKDVDIV
jgi:hypothetical protein